MSELQSPSQTVGPMYGFALCAEDMSRSVEPGDPAELQIEGTIRDGDGEPLCHPDAFVELWEGEQMTRARSDALGVWRVWMKRPENAPPFPDGSPQAPHFNVTVWARGLLKQAQTRLYLPDEQEANATDALLARVDPVRRKLLIAAPLGPSRLRFDVDLQGEREMVFFDF